MDVLTQEMIPLVRDAGATLVIVILLINQWKKDKLQHERSLARDESFVRVLDKQHVALLDCVKDRLSDS